MRTIKICSPLPINRKAPDYYGMYHSAFIKALETTPEGGGVYRIVYYGVKLVGQMDIDRFYELDSIYNALALIEFVKISIKPLTPNEIMRLFPVSKTYDGERWQSKDYYFTMAALKRHGLDTPIGEEVDAILWDYMNDDLMAFNVNLMSIAGRLHKAETGRDMLTDFFDSIGKNIPTYTMTTDQRTGNQYMINNDTGAYMRARKPIPRYLKVINGYQRLI